MPRNTFCTGPNQPYHQPAARRPNEATKQIRSLLSLMASSHWKEGVRKESNKHSSETWHGNGGPRLLVALLLPSVRHPATQVLLQLSLKPIAHRLGSVPVA